MSLDRMERRQFLKSSSIGMLAAGCVWPGRAAAQAGKAQEIKLPTRTLGRTGVKIPILSFGVMNTDSPDLIKRALDAGIIHLDTAHGYLRGNSETAIGRVVKERGGRDQLIIATKVWLARDHQTGAFSTQASGRGPAATAENLNQMLNLSLERLQTDYVDILYLHSCDSAQMVNYEPLMNAAVAAQKAGRVRFIGVSCHGPVAEVVRAAADANIYDVAEIAFNLQREDKEETEKAIAYAKEKGLGIVAMKTQGGKRRDEKVPMNHKASLKWVLRHEQVTTAIPGMTTFDQLELNLAAAADLDLDEEEKNYIKLGSLEAGAQCQSCRSCVATCPHHVDIPTLMRAAMYAGGYGNLSHAEWTLSTLPEQYGLQVCGLCETCTASCSHHLNIGGRVAELKKTFRLPLA